MHAGAGGSQQPATVGIQTIISPANNQHTAQEQGKAAGMALSLQIVLAIQQGQKPESIAQRLDATLTEVRALQKAMAKNT